MRKLKWRGYPFPAIFLILILIAPILTDLEAQTSVMSPNYPGPERPADQVASLSPAGGLFWIKAINGGGNDSLSLLPGRHAVTIAIRGIGTGETVLFFDARAGHRYQPRGYVDGSQAVVTIVNLATMESVSGGSGFVEENVWKFTNYNVRDDHGNWQSIGHEQKRIGTLPDGVELHIHAVQTTNLVRNLGQNTSSAIVEKGLYRYLNTKGFAIMDGPAKFMANQHVDLYEKKGAWLAALYVGEGSPIISRKGKLYAILESGEIADLAAMTESQKNKVSGLGQKIAQSFSEMAVTRFSSPTFYFTHATGGELFVRMTVKIKGGKKELLVIGERTG